MLVENEIKGGDRVTEFLWVSAIHNGALRVSTTIESACPWISEAKSKNCLRCRAIPGRVQGIQLYPPGFQPPYYDRIQTFVSSLRLGDIDPNDIKEKTAKLLRFAFTQWETKIKYSKEKKQNRFIFWIPKPVFDLGFIPDSEKTLLICGCGNFIEVWPVSLWREDYQRGGALGEGLIEEAEIERMSEPNESD